MRRSATLVSVAVAVVAIVLGCADVVVPVQAQTPPTMSPSLATANAAPTTNGTTTTNDTTTNDTTTNDDDEATCVAESTALNTDGGVSAATQDLLTTTKDDILADLNSFCKVLSLTCTVDLQPYSSDLDVACTEAGGQILKQQINFGCRSDTGVLDALGIRGKVELINVPACIGASCDPNNLPPALTQVSTNVFQSINEEIDAALGDSIVCQMQTTDSGAIRRSSMRILLTGMMALVVATFLAY